MREAILYYAIKYKGEYHRITQAIKMKEKVEKVSYSGKYITILDKEYPVSLLRLRYRPWILFYEGNLSLLQKEMVAVVGTRNMTSYGQYCTSFLLTHLHKEYGIVSGLAKGIDLCAHKQALETNRDTVAVVGNGIDVSYPKEHAKWYETIKQKGLLLSEYPFGVKPLAHHFPWRNRIIAGLSKHLVVIEAKKRSGTMITVNEALDIGVEVSCFPHDITRESGEGCHHILFQGGNLLYDSASIKEI